MEKNDALAQAIRSIAQANMEWVKLYLESHGCNLTSFLTIDAVIQEDKEAIEILKGLEDEDKT